MVRVSIVYRQWVFVIMAVLQRTWHAACLALQLRTCFCTCLCTCTCLCPCLAAPVAAHVAAPVFASASAPVSMHMPLHSPLHMPLHCLCSCHCACLCTYHCTYHCACLHVPLYTPSYLHGWTDAARREGACWLWNLHDFALRMHTRTHPCSPAPPHTRMHSTASFVHAMVATHACTYHCERTNIALSSPTSLNSTII